MTSCRIFVIVVFLSSCKSQQYKEYLKVKIEHEKNLEMIQLATEPYYNKIADSMKNWISILKRVYINDQKNRLIGYGFTKSGLKEQKFLDSINLKIVTTYIDKYGWPTLNQIGFFGQLAIGMVIQHSPLKVQEKYYPRLVDAFKSDSTLYETLAMLEDRINAKNHRMQFYGTQMRFFGGKQVLYPVFDIDSLENRRKKIGFKITMSEYLKHFKLEWNINEYKEILSILITEFKVSDTSGLHYKF